ncbi:GNAT family N-acetyltransferase [Acinetobacter sp. LoGeW2-3]|uniref:GNAT family N-acetyltransferase n=1 Tax=Acinetobacter sp. LoGeW2-3 TaxID=1808001 RepID=UPI000C05C0C0|nr:GNAT family N-acetyltransferase [Acinetobacter sp. LoGeW2-3]ATO18804.1 GNAT family N-acetyltransferase [Acinetobacter sp. LoGeW2-3]
MLEIVSTSVDQHPALLELWEHSVRATHHFLNDAQILKIRQQIIQHGYFDQVQLFHVEHQQQILGFMGIAGSKLEMLFISPSAFRQGIGSQLLQHALELGVAEVDVNEQNPDAVTFYLKHGFEMISRSETDSEGNPYPILHLQLKN